MSHPHELSRPQAQDLLPLDDQLRIRDELHSVQIGLDLLRQEMLSGDYSGADLTYAAIEHCLRRLSNDAVLATTRSPLPR